jgi:hypothetical protein
MTPREFLEARLDDYAKGFDENRIYPWGDGPKFGEMLRAVLKFHDAWPVLVSAVPDMHFEMVEPDKISYFMQQKFEWLTQEEYKEKFGSEPPTSPILSAWLVPWRTHPDFQTEWL